MLNMGTHMVACAHNSQSFASGAIGCDKKMRDHLLGLETCALWLLARR